MIAWACSLEQLRDRIDSLIRVKGPKTVVGTPRDRSVYHTTDYKRVTGGYLDCDLGVQIELVYIDKTGLIVGDEANDYRPKPGEFAAVKIS